MLPQLSSNGKGWGTCDLALRIGLSLIFRWRNRGRPHVPEFRRLRLVHIVIYIHTYIHTQTLVLKISWVLSVASWIFFLDVESFYHFDITWYQLHIYFYDVSHHPCSSFLRINEYQVLVEFLWSAYFSNVYCKFSYLVCSLLISGEYNAFLLPRYDS